MPRAWDVLFAQAEHAILNAQETHFSNWTMSNPLAWHMPIWKLTLVFFTSYVSRVTCSGFSHYHVFGKQEFHRWCVAYRIGNIHEYDCYNISTDIWQKFGTPSSSIVAVCVTGQLRTLLQVEWQRHWLAYLGNVRPDIFIHAGKSFEYAKSSPMSGVIDDPVTKEAKQNLSSMGAVELLKKTLRPVFFSFEVS